MEIFPSTCKGWSPTLWKCTRFVLPGNDEEQIFDGGGGAVDSISVSVVIAAEGDDGDDKEVSLGEEGEWGESGFNEST